MALYNAFISYSHTADGRLAAALQSSLHSFAKPWYKLRALHIFRDQTNLAVNPALWSSIREALDQSLYLILLASPEAAASPWVAKEAEYWIGKNGPSHVLIVLTGGVLAWDRVSGSFLAETTTALPVSLLHLFPEEPLYLDLEWAREGSTPLRMREPRFHEAVLQLAATLHNRPKDELDGADIRSQRHTRNLAAFGLIAILAASLFAFRQTRVSREESVQNLAASLASESAKVLADNPDRAREAALLAIESNRLHPSFEGNRALRAAVSVLPAAAQFYPPESADPAERVRALAFSPNGATLAVDRDDGSTQLIDVVGKKAIGYFGPDEQPAASIELPGASSGDAGHNEAVSVAFNSAGSLVATGARDGVVRVWDFPGGRERLRISHAAAISQVAFRPKVDQFATASEDGHVRVFDVARSALAADFQCADKVVATAFSPGGDVLAALSSEGVVSVFDVEHHKLLRTMGGGEAGFSLAFSNDGKRLVVATGDFASVWDVATGRLLLKATHAASSETLTPQEWIVDAAISSDGKFLAYAARGDNLARVWNVDTGRPILELKHDSAVATVSFNADGTKLGTGSYDGTARVWELPSGRELDRVSHGGGAEAVAFDVAGARFAAGGLDGSVSVSEASRADRPANFDLPGRVGSVAFGPDGRRFAIGTISAHWSPLVRIADIDGKTVRDIEFQGAPSLDKLVFSDPDKVIAQWSDKLFLISIEKSSATVLPKVSGEIRIDPSGKVLASQQNGVSHLYTLPGVRGSATLDGPSSGLLRSADEGKLLAFETTQPPRQTFLEIWNVASKSRVSRMLLPAELNHIAFNPSGTTAFTAESENLQAWDVASGKLRFSLTASGDIEFIISDPSSTAFATVTHGRLTVWDGGTGARLAELPDVGYIRSAAFSPDGRYLLAGYDERSAALWLWRSDDLRVQACARLTQNLSHAEWERWFHKQAYRPTCSGLAPAP